MNRPAATTPSVNSIGSNVLSIPTTSVVKGEHLGPNGGIRSGTKAIGSHIWAQMWRSLVGRLQQEDRVAVFRAARAPRVETVEGDIGGELAVERGETLALVVDHRAGDPEHSFAGIEELHEPGLARPVGE